MNRRIFTLGAASTAFLAACGGGGGAAPARRMTLGWYASSVGTGYYATESLGTLRIPRPPVRVLAELTESTVADYSVPGGGAQLALDGGPGMPFQAFKDHIPKADIDVALFWYGGVEALFGMPVGDFRVATGKLVDLTLAAGKRAVLITNPRLVRFEAALAAVNAAIADVARSRGAPLVDLWDLPYTTVEDNTHPDQAYIDRAMPRVVAPLTELLR